MDYEALFYNIVTPFEDVNKFYEMSEQTLWFLYTQFISDIKLSKVVD